MKNVTSYIFGSRKGYRTMTSGWQGAPYSRRYGPELVSKPAISLKKIWGGYRRSPGWLWREDFEHVQQHHDVFPPEAKPLQKVKFIPPLIHEVAMRIGAH